MVERERGLLHVKDGFGGGEDQISLNNLFVIEFFKQKIKYFFLVSIQFFGVDSRASKSFGCVDFQHVGAKENKEF